MDIHSHTINHTAPHITTHIINTHTLTEKQRQAVQDLVSLCCQNDGIHLSYPFGLDPEECEHYLLFSPDQTLLGALGLVFYDYGTAECSAFVHPDYRRQGCFSKLFDLAVNACEDLDILFPVSERCPDTMAALQALGAELDYKEHQMELIMTPESVSRRGRITLPSLFVDPSTVYDKDTLWKFARSRTSDADAPAVGTCRTFLLSEECVCLHHVEILPQLRGLGYGTAMLSLLLQRLFDKGIRKIILQVTDDNTPAMALYKKTGFRITETLSFYLY